MWARAGGGGQAGRQVEVAEVVLDGRTACQFPRLRDFADFVVLTKGSTGHASGVGADLRAQLAAARPRVRGNSFGVLCQFCPTVRLSR